MSWPRTSLCALAGLVALLSFVSGASGAVTVRIGQSFPGAAFGKDSNAEPADSNGAAGPNHIVEFVNGRYSVYSKNGGAPVQTSTDQSFWTKLGVSFPSRVQVTDPRIIFDLDSQRWFASQIDFNPNNQANNRFLLAVSVSADPTGTWHAFAFTADPVHGYFADFPTLGIDTNGVYLAGDMFDRAGNSVGPTLVSLPKSALLADNPSVTGRTSFGVLSYSAHGYILQPAVTTGSASTPESVLAVGDLGTDFATHTTLLAATVQNATQAGAASLGTATVITVPRYTSPINPPQPDGSDNLDDGDARLSACVRRVGDVLYAVHGTQVGGRAAIRWYTIEATNNRLIQSGTIADPVLNLYYPSIAANEAGVAVIGCNGSSSKTFVSSYASVGETVSGSLSFGSLLLLKEGTGSYQSPDSSGTSRWGDYNATTVDPADPDRFWLVQLYAASTTAWATQITELITAPIHLRIVWAGQNVLVSWPASATGFQLQSSPSLTPPNWTPVAATPVVSNDLAGVSLSATNSLTFFRLAGSGS